MVKDQHVSMFFQWIKRRKFLSEVMASFGIEKFKIKFTYKSVKKHFVDVYSVKRMTSKRIGFTELFNALDQYDGETILNHSVRASGYEFSVISDIEMKTCFGVLRSSNAPTAAVRSGA